MCVCVSRRATITSWIYLGPWGGSRTAWSAQSELCDMPGLLIEGRRDPDTHVCWWRADARCRGRSGTKTRLEDGGTSACPSVWRWLTTKRLTWLGYSAVWKTQVILSHPGEAPVSPRSPSSTPAIQRFTCNNRFSIQVRGMSQESETIKMSKIQWNNNVFMLCLTNITDFYWFGFYSGIFLHICPPHGSNWLWCNMEMQYNYSF